MFGGKGTPSTIRIPLPARLRRWAIETTRPLTAGASADGDLSVMLSGVMGREVAGGLEVREGTADGAGVWLWKIGGLRVVDLSMNDGEAITPIKDRTRLARVQRDVVLGESREWVFIGGLAGRQPD